MANSKGLDLVLTVATRFGGKTINMLVFFLVARNLSLSEMGIYGIIFSMSLILSTVLDVGIRNSAAIFVGKDLEHMSDYARQSLFLWGMLSLLAPPLMWVSLNNSGYGDVPSTYQAPAIVLLISMLYLRVMQGVLLGAGKIAMYNRSELASRTILLVTTVFLLSTGRLDLLGALWSLAISQLGSAIYLFLIQRELLRSGGSGLRSDIIKALLARGFMFMVSVLAMNATKRVSFLAIGHFVDSDKSGLFFALQRLTEIITEVGLAVSIVVFSSNVRASSTEEAVRETARSTRLCFSIFIVIAGAISVTAPWAVPILLGSKFAGHTLLFQVTLLATLIGSIWTIIFPSLSVVSTPTKVFFLFLPGLAANIILVFPMMEWFGLTGAAIAMVLASTILTTSFLLYYRYKFGVPMRDFLVLRADDLAGVRKLLKRANG